MSAEAPEWLTLEDGEEIEWVGEPELASKASELLTGLFLLPFLGLGLFVMVPAYLQVDHTDYVVTSQSLYAKSGILSTNIKSVELDKIQNTEYSQSFVEKQLGYGTVGVDTAGGSGTELAFEAIANAREVQETVRELSRAYRETGAESAGGESAGPAPISEVADELERTREALENVDAAISQALAARRTGNGAAGTAETGDDPTPSADGRAAADGERARDAGLEEPEPDE